jgi:iron complex outermembrane receptor protein
MKKTLHLRGWLAAGASVAALVAAAPAFAAPAAAPAAAANPETTVGEIIVTAERREASIQSVPIAVTAFTAKERAVQGINTVQDMTNFTPGLTYSSQLDRPVMRGLAKNNNQYSTDSAVAIYYDDFYSNSTFLTGRDDLLIDQVEVLLGPQGTLYGRNAVGGLINTVSKRPSEDFNGEVRAIVGNYGYNKIEGTITGPIADNLTFRASAYDMNQSQGYLKNLAGGPSEGDVRHDPYFDLQLQYKGDKNEVWLDSYVYGANHDRGGPGGLLGIPESGHYDTASTTEGQLTFNPNFPYGGGAVPGSVVGMIPGSDNPALHNIREFAHSIPTDITVNAAFAFNFHFIHHFDGFDMKYVGGYAQYHYNLANSNYFNNDNSSITQYQIPAAPGVTPLTVFPNQNFQYETQTSWYSHELDFSSTTNSALQWIGGVYRYDEIDDNLSAASNYQQPQMEDPLLNIGQGDAILPGTPLPNPTRDSVFLKYEDHIMSSAVFGQLDWKITDTLKLTGGLRYTYDQKGAGEQTRFVAFQNVAPLLEASALGVRFPSLDITQSQIDINPQKGVTRVPTLATTGQYAGDYVATLSDTGSAVTGTAGIEWTPDRQTLVYGRYNRGYKAFGFNAGYDGPSAESKPEYVDDVEVGIKKGFGRTFQIDADVFYYNYTDDQVPISILTGGISNTNFLNIPNSVSDGFEMSANWSPIERLNLSLVYGFNNTSISSSCNLSNGVATGFCVQDSVDPNAMAAGAHPVGGTGVQSVKGNPLPQAPRNKVGFNANYTWEFEPGNLTLSGSYVWKDASYAEIFNRSYNEAPSWSQVDARLIWAGNHDKYEVVFYVKNLFNTLGYDAAAAGDAISSPVGGGGLTQASVYDLTPPRLFGAEVHYKF